MSSVTWVFNTSQKLTSTSSWRGVEVKELVDSRKVDSSPEGWKITRLYETLTATDPEQVALYAPAYGDPHPEFDLITVSNLQLVPHGNKVRITVTYTELPLSATLDREIWEWDIGARQVQVYSVKNDSYCAHYPSASDVGTTIGVDDDGNVEGCPAYRPMNSLRVTKLWETMDDTYMDTLRSLSCTVNDAGWYMYLANELLFLGARVRKTTQGFWQVEYEFVEAPHQGVQSIDLIDGSSVNVSIPPWDYVWTPIAKRPIIDGDGVEIVQRKPRSVHLAKVQEQGNFTTLGLTGPYAWG